VLIGQQITSVIVCDVCWRLAGPRVVVSSNVLAENLHTERHLETSYYVTSARQMTDFAWYRRSGVRINVAARDISLVPACRDVINMEAARAPGTSLR